MINRPLPRLDANPDIRASLLKHCRLQRGEVWQDPECKHRVGCLDAASRTDARRLMGGAKAALAVQDPPYNVAAFGQRKIGEYIDWCKAWVANTDWALLDNASLYVWVGADQKTDFQPLPDFMIMMRETPFRSRSLITMRNQRGYGTQRNWMAVRQELLYYTKGDPVFNVDAEYTDIPKILRGYYKKVNGRLAENTERGKSETIRAGNVWVDIQQVFYRMEENVSGCYAQKPLKSAQRILMSGSRPQDVVMDFFCHSGSTLLAAETLGRRCYTMDCDPVYAEIAIRRLERFRSTGKTGWQNGNPFEQETLTDADLSAAIAQARGAAASPQPALI